MPENIKFRWFLIVLLGIGLFIFSSCSQIIVDPNYNVGQKLSMQGQHAEAIRHYELAIQKNPNDYLGWYGLGYSYNRLGRHKEAIQAYERSRSINSQYSGTANNLGHSYIQLGDYQSARIYFEEALRIDPNNSLARTNLASLSQTNSPQNQNSSSSNSFYALYDKGFKLYEAGNYRESLDAYKEALKINPKNAETYDAIGANYEKLGNHQQAIAYYKEAVRFNPNEASLLTTLGGVYADIGLNNEAITYYKESLRLNPNNNNVFNDLGVAYYGLDDYINAIASYKESIRLSPNIATSYFNMGEVLEKIAKQKQNIELLKEAYDYYYKSLERNNRLTVAKDKIRELTIVLEAINNKNQQPKIAEGTVLGTGTGFLVASQKYVVTNSHVVEGAGTIKVKFLNGEVIEATVESKDISNDVAVLKLSKTTSTNINKLKLGDPSQMRLGDKIFTVGFPMTNMLGTNLKYSEGVISSVTGLQDDPRFFQISVPIQPGNSGGPLFNMDGEIIGITTATIGTVRAIERTGGTIPQNVNFAIKSSFVRNTLGSIHSHQISSDHLTPLRNLIKNVQGNVDLRDFIEKLRGNIALIQVEK
jgi:tetratricopeptide (TPR) repeat protein